MKYLQLILPGILLMHYGILPAQDSLKFAESDGNKVSFVTTIDISQATKDGIYCNGYVVNIPSNMLNKLSGKKIRIRGKVTIVKGLDHYKDGVIRQGRQNDTKHILKPKIKIVDD